MDIDISINAAFKDKLKENFLQQAAKQTLTAENVTGGVEMGILVTSQEKIHQLNQQYRHKDRPTDVLAFQMETANAFATPPDKVRHLGEVIISYPQAQIQADEGEHTVEKEMAILLIHGTLHLLGYDHHTDEDEKKMKDREAAILNQMGELK